MAYTLSTLTEAVKDYTENSEEKFTKYIPDFIRFAEERILKAAQLFNFQDTIKVHLEKGNRCIDKPCDWLATYALTLREAGDASVRWTLLNKDKNFLDSYWPDYTKVDTPKYYTDYGSNQFAVAPTPDRHCYAYLHYLRRPTSLVDSKGEPTWLSINAQQALLFATLIEAYGFLKGEQEMMAFYNSRFDESIIRLRNHGESLENDDSLRRGVIRTQPT